MNAMQDILGIAILIGIVVLIVALIWMIVNKIRYESLIGPLIMLLVGFVLTSVASFGIYKTDFSDKTMLPDVSIAVDVSEDNLTSDDSSNWKIVHREDEFGDPIGGVYLMYDAIGWFSNSATLASDLVVSCFYDDDTFPGFIFVPLEYGDNPATFYDRNDEVQYSIKEGDGNKYSFKTYLYPTDYALPVNFLTISSKDISIAHVFNTFYNGGIVEIHISVGSSSYKFTINCTEFSKMWEEMKALNKDYREHSDM
jgi:hypothetical protein